jgi:putative ATP-dependent endonuclease of OLD family
MVLFNSGRAFGLPSGKTQLDSTDYGFPQRLLDVTKANLFFARGLTIVEGDSENILVPTLARMLGLDFTEP